MRKLINNALLTCALAVMLAPNAAGAHAFLKSAMPAVGSTIDVAPKAIEITFTESVEPDFSAIAVQDGHGARVDKDDTHPVAGSDNRLAVSVGALPPGAYTVIWHVTATDTHKTTGNFVFTVAH